MLSNIVSTNQFSWIGSYWSTSKNISWESDRIHESLVIFLNRGLNKFKLQEAKMQNENVMIGISYATIWDNILILWDLYHDYCYVYAFMSVWGRIERDTCAAREWLMSFYQYHEHSNTIAVQVSSTHLISFHLSSDNYGTI